MSTSAINLDAPVVNDPTSTNNLVGTGATANLANQNVFLQLLVAQLKYQDPDSPADGTAFVTQLAQFSELSNTTQSTSDLNNINTLLTANAAALAAQTPTTTGTSTTGTSTTGKPAV